MITEHSFRVATEGCGLRGVTYLFLWISKSTEIEWTDSKKIEWTDSTHTKKR